MTSRNGDYGIALNRWFFGLAWRILAALLVFSVMASLAKADPRNMEDVAREALIEAKACSGGVRECGGGIFQTPDGSYIATTAISGQQFGLDLGSMLLHAPSGFRLVADYHVHICSRHNALFANYFSPADGMVNEGFHTVGYMLSLCDHNIHRFDPQEFPREVMVVQFHSGRELELPLGHISGWLP